MDTVASRLSMKGPSIYRTETMQQDAGYGDKAATMLDTSLVAGKEYHICDDYLPINVRLLP